MIRFLPISLLVTTAIMAVAAPVSNAAIYIKFDGIKGTVASHSQRGQILIESVDAPSAAARGASAGKVHAIELTFRAPVAQARGGEQQDYYKVTLEDVLVSSYQTSAKEFGLSINYARIIHTGTGKTMAAEVLASALGQAGGANFLLADGSVRFVS